MTDLRTNDFGFWRSLSSFSVGQVLASWDFITAVVIAVPGTIVYVRHQANVDEHTALVGHYLSLSGALFGVVLAGFAVVAALLGDKYARLLDASNASALQMLRHFLVVAGLLVASITLSILFLAGAEPLEGWRPGAEQAALGVTTFVCFWALFGALELMKLVLGVATTSTVLRRIEDVGSETQRRSNG